MRAMPQRFDPTDWPRPTTVLVLAPHPDDFDAIGVTLRALAAHGHALHLAVLTPGSSGVDDGFQGALDDDAKAALREQEQLASCRFFGLPAARCHFLRLWQRADRAVDDAERLRTLVRQLQPGLVFMPHGNDSNATHRRSYEAFHALAQAERLTLQACLNQDAKTQGLRPDRVMPFGEAEAAWKAQLLRHHESQQQRNQRSRGHGFDARVVQVNRDAAAGLGLAEPYAEVFELARYVDGRVQT
ncbi:MAG: PIG-L family deacetylase [Burkholderiales bacterium]|nr:PIG-L family deacetylase [Burkholderiales bacterium]